MDLKSRKKHYSWKRCVCAGITADTAIDEFKRAEQEFGALTAKNLLNISRDKDAPLHGAFEWDDSVAGELYRENQAGQIIRAVVADVSDDDDEPIRVRAFVPVNSGDETESDNANRYVSIERVIGNAEYFQQVKNRAFSELTSFEKKYAALLKIQPEVEIIKDKVQSVQL